MSEAKNYTWLQELNVLGEKERVEKNFKKINLKISFRIVNIFTWFTILKVP